MLDFGLLIILNIPLGGVCIIFVVVRNLKFALCSLRISLFGSCDIDICLWLTLFNYGVFFLIFQLLALRGNDIWICGNTCVIKVFNDDMQVELIWPSRRHLLLLLLLLWGHFFITLLEHNCDWLLLFTNLVIIDLHHLVAVDIINIVTITVQVILVPAGIDELLLGLIKLLDTALRLDVVVVFFVWRLVAVTVCTELCVASALRIFLGLPLYTDLARVELGLPWSHWLHWWLVWWARNLALSTMIPLIISIYWALVSLLSIAEIVFSLIFIWLLISTAAAELIK